MGKGNLVITARTADDALPLSGARVEILNHEGTVLYDLITDESGETQIVSLDAVDKSLSLDPNYTGTPYSTYDIAAKADGFNDVYISNIQIFDGETANKTI